MSALPHPVGRPPADPLGLLAEGDVDVKGRLPWSSNATFLVEVCQGEESDLAVYKPVRGERPLRDFPPGLHRREVAAWVLSEALGWGITPETVLRDDTPLGPGSLQRFVDALHEEHHFTLVEDPAHHPRLAQICVFDVLANNTDRKSGHCVLGRDGVIYGIDHGLCFHVRPKLRTVIWEFAGEEVPTALVDDVARVGADPPPELAELLDPTELDALVARAAALVDDPVFPLPGSGRSFPWPMV